MKMMQKPLLISMVATAKFSQKVDSCGFSNAATEMKSTRKVGRELMFCDFSGCC
jgi:hypothetical protein